MSSAGKASWEINSVSWICTYESTQILSNKVSEVNSLQLISVNPKTIHHNFSIPKLKNSCQVPYLWWSRWSDRCSIRDFLWIKDSLECKTRRLILSQSLIRGSTYRQSLFCTAGSFALLKYQHGLWGLGLLFFFKIPQSFWSCWSQGWIENFAQDILVSTYLWESKLWDQEEFSSEFET